MEVSKNAFKAEAFDDKKREWHPDAGLRNPDCPPVIGTGGCAENMG
jgi:hypothetical protein